MVFSKLNKSTVRGTSSCVAPFFRVIAHISWLEPCPMIGSQPQYLHSFCFVPKALVSHFMIAEGHICTRRVQKHVSARKSGIGMIRQDTLMVNTMAQTRRKRRGVPDNLPRPLKNKLSYILATMIYKPRLLISCFSFFLSFCSILPNARPCSFCFRSLLCC